MREDDAASASARCELLLLAGHRLPCSRRPPFGSPSLLITRARSRRRLRVRSRRARLFSSQPQRFPRRLDPLRSETGRRLARATAQFSETVSRYDRDWEQEDEGAQAAEQQPLVERRLGLDDLERSSAAASSLSGWTGRESTVSRSLKKTRTGPSSGACSLREVAGLSETREKASRRTRPASLTRPRALSGSACSTQADALQHLGPSSAKGRGEKGERRDPEAGRTRATASGALLLRARASDQRMPKRRCRETGDVQRAVTRRTCLEAWSGEGGRGGRGGDSSGRASSERRLVGQELSASRAQARLGLGEWW